jgi:hypothetical protein
MPDNFQKLLAMHDNALQFTLFHSTFLHFVHVSTTSMKNCDLLIALLKMNH